MLIKKEQKPLLAVIMLAVLSFSIFYISRQNYEFMLYIGVIIFFVFIILLTNHKVDYPLTILWGLVFWALLHMAGGSFALGGARVYELMIFDLAGEPYNIFRYDQLVHIIGFGVSTLLMYHLISPLLKEKYLRPSLAVVVVMAGLGVGAVNEIIEFIATVILPETGVGGYENTSLDLVSDLIGAGLAAVYLKFSVR